MSETVRVVLLNPPAQGGIIRDCWDSRRQKGRYYWHPLDPLVTGARLLDAGIGVRWRDAVAEQLTIEETFRWLRQQNPDYVFSLCGWTSWQEDRRFFERLADRLPNALLVAMGDVIRLETAAFLADCPAIDYAFTDFLVGDPVAFCRQPDANHDGFISSRAAPDLDRASFIPRAKRHFSYPSPPAKWMAHPRYRLPFPGAHPFASILTSAGCPYSCEYCQLRDVAMTTRPTAEVLDDVRLAIRSGVRHLYFRDPTFNGDQRHFRSILEGLIEIGAPVTWSAFVRPELFTDELLVMAKRSGARLLQFGMESKGEYINRGYRRGMKRSRVIDVLRLCRRLSIETVGHFMIGFPEQTETDIENDYRWLLDAPLSFATVGIYEIRMGTPAWQSYLAQFDELLPELNRRHNGLYPPWRSSDEQRHWQSIKSRMMRRFYLRPGIIRRLAPQLLSPRDLSQLFANAINVLKGS